MPGTRIRSTGTSPTPRAALPGAARAAAATWGLAAAALLAATPAPAQDLVILRDGARQAGTLASCVGEVCVLDGRQFPKGEIAWVGLGREGAPPASATGGELDEVHLASGEAVPGTVVGVSLGTVAMASGSYDRREVAWIRFAGAEAPRHDVLVLRGGGALEGELQSCVGDACTLESQSVPLAGIAWIGLAVAEVAPPGGGVPAEGVLHLADGTETAGRLVGISAGQVVSDRGSYPRQQVAWVGVPVPEPDRGPQPGQIGAPLPDPTSPGAESPAPPTPDLPPAPPLPPPPAGAGGTPHPTDGRRTCPEIRAELAAIFAELERMLEQKREYERAAEERIEHIREAIADVNRHYSELKRKVEKAMDAEIEWLRRKIANYQQLYNDMRGEAPGGQIGVAFMMGLWEAEIAALENGTHKKFNEMMGGEFAEMAELEEQRERLENRLAGALVDYEESMKEFDKREADLRRQYDEANRRLADCEEDEVDPDAAGHQNPCIDNKGAFSWICP